MGLLSEWTRFRGAIDAAILSYLRRQASGGRGNNLAGSSVGNDFGEIPTVCELRSTSMQ